MARTFIDSDLATWEVYSSGGDHGLPQNPKIVFHCLSKPSLRARYVVYDGDSTDAEEAVREMSPDRLALLFESSVAMD